MDVKQRRAEEPRQINAISLQIRRPSKPSRWSVPADWLVKDE